MLPALMGLKIALVAGLSIFVAATGVKYSGDVKTAKKQLASYKLSEVTTTHGKISFIDEGQGTPLLVIHGICGGYDQGYACARYYIEKGFRVIVPSRFGYPGSDMPKDSSPKAQADAFRQLLEKLDITQIHIIAQSAGGPSALRFAQDYPEMTKGLILQSANVPTPPVAFKNPPDFIYNDFPMWAAVKSNKNFFLKMFGVDVAAYKAAPPEERRNLEEMFDALLPMKARRAGILNDNRVTNPDTSVHYDEYKLEQIKVPVLFINAKDDPMAKFPGVEAAYKRVPGAELKAFENGGHVMFGHGHEGDEAIINFVERHK